MVSSQIPRAPVPRCAVLFALPTDRETFDAVARGELLLDYRRLLFRGDTTESVWVNRYQRIAEAARDLMVAAGALNATVVTRATLADVRSASSSHDVLVVIGHWRGWTVFGSDLLADDLDLLARLDRAGMGDLAVIADRKNIRGGLVRGLNAAIESGALLTKLEPAIAASIGHPAVAAALARDLVDEALGDGITPGNRVELCDGLHTPKDFETALEPGFVGDLDLATCSSVVLATFVKRRRGDSLKVVHTLDLVDPLVCMIAIAATLREVKASGRCYSAARLDVEFQLAELRKEMPEGDR